MRETPSRPYAFIIPLAVAAISMVLFFMGVINGWFGAPGSNASEFCEASRQGLIKQPYNTWSNISFILAGLSIGWLLMQGQFSHNQNSITQTAFYGTFYACIVVLLGPGSMAMHATTGSLGGFFDMLSMYLIASFTTAYAAERFFRLKPLYFVIIYSLVLVFCIWANFAPYHIIFDFFGDTVFLLLIVLTVILEAMNTFLRKLQHNIRWGFGSLISICAAFFIWNITQTGTPLCYPYSPFQGHAAWHILDAFSAFCLFMFYASEHSTSKV